MIDDYDGDSNINVYVNKRDGDSITQAFNMIQSRAAKYINKDNG